MDGSSAGNSRTIQQSAADRETRRVTWVSLAANLVLSGLKFVGGLLGGSQAVVADAVHSLSDSTTDLAILVGIRYWSKPPDATHPHGHRRVETLVTTAIGMALAVVAAGLLWNAISTLGEPHTTRPKWIALVAALVSIASKETLYRWTAAAGRRIRSMPLTANAWHHRSDSLSSIPAALAVGGAMIHPAWSFLDHVGAVVVSLFIFQAAFKIIFPEMGKLLDSGASEETLRHIHSLALGVPGVRYVHRLRTRYCGSTCLAVDLHIKVDGNLTVDAGHDISEIVKRELLASDSDIVDVVVHLEPYKGERPS